MYHALTSHSVEQGIEIIENSEDQNFHLFSTTTTIKPF
jgi:hypothetical protein